MADQILQVIDALCEKLGVAADYLMPLLVKQSYVDGTAALFWILFAIGASIYLTKVVKNQTERYISSARQDLDFTCLKVTIHDYWRLWLIIPSVLMLVACVIILICNVCTAVNALANPEWYAIQKLISLAR